eukprot:gene16743-20101_t
MTKPARPTGRIAAGAATLHVAQIPLSGVDDVFVGSTVPSVPGPFPCLSTPESGAGSGRLPPPKCGCPAGCQMPAGTNTTKPAGAPDTWEAWTCSATSPAACCPAKPEPCCCGHRACGAAPQITVCPNDADTAVCDISPMVECTDPAAVVSEVVMPPIYVRVFDKPGRNPKRLTPLNVTLSIKKTAPVAKPRKIAYKHWKLVVTANGGGAAAASMLCIDDFVLKKQGG